MPVLPPTSPALVTGGTGFLGRRIVARLLDQGRRVTVLARTPAPDLEALGVRMILAPLANAAAVRAACDGAETVFHVAARVGVWGRAADFHSANVLGTQAVIDGCREHGVRRLVYTSSPSVVYSGGDLAGVDEKMPLALACPSDYPLTKAAAERAVLSANSPALRTVALRPHLIWGVGDPHLVPRLLDRARAGRLRIVGRGRNRVDLVHVENAADAHLLAERALGETAALGLDRGARPVAGRAFFITNGEPVLLWDWINGLLADLGEPPVKKRIPLAVAFALGLVCEGLWQALPLRGEPPMTRFVASELARDHWFNLTAARRDLGYQPRVTMAAGQAELVAHLKRSAGVPPRTG